MRDRLVFSLLVIACTSAGERYDFATGAGLGDAATSSNVASDSSAASSEGASSSDGGPSSTTMPAGTSDADSESSDALDASTTAIPGGSPMHGDPAMGVPEFEALFDEIEGWATGTTGGLAGTVFVVDTLADAGDRSLRAALESPSAHWIVFADGVNGLIELEDTIRPGSDKTVDARGHAIQLRGGGESNPFTGLKIEGRSNLVFVNLVLDDELENWDRDSEGADGITITSSDHIWIHHCTFARWVDGAIDIRRDGELPHHISVTWSRFSRVYQALNWTADLVSFGHNTCDRIRRRCIQVIEGKGHSWNNVIADWNAASIQTAKDGGQLYSMHNMLDPGGVAEVNARVGGGKIRNRDHHAWGNVQYAGGNDALDEQFEHDSEMLAVIEECGDDACWNDLRDRVEAEAGAH